MANVDLSDPTFWTEDTEIFGTVDIGPPGVAEVTSANSFPVNVPPYENEATAFVIIALDDPTRIDDAPGSEWIFTVTPTHNAVSWDPTEPTRGIYVTIEYTTAFDGPQLVGAAATTPFGVFVSGETQEISVDVTDTVALLTPPITAIKLYLTTQNAFSDADADLTFVLETVEVGLTAVGEATRFWTSLQGATEYP